MTIDLAFDDGQEAIAEALKQFCRDACDADRVKELSGTFPTELWSSLAELGMLSIGTPEGEGGALELVAAMEPLGAAVFPGPLVATFLATRLLEGDELEALVEGHTIVSAGQAGLMPWAPCADLFLEIEGEHVWRARALGEVSGIDTLGGEPWGRVRLEREQAFEKGPEALVFADIAAAAYQAGAAQALVEAASEHAASRTQFGRPIGEFQAVSHPLVDCHIGLAAAATLARKAAFVFDEKGSGPSAAKFYATAARSSANAAALQSVYVCHQVFGAIGITLEGPAFHLTRRIRQLASQPPSLQAGRVAILDAIGMGNASA